MEASKACKTCSFIMHPQATCGTVADEQRASIDSLRWELIVLQRRLTFLLWKAMPAEACTCFNTCTVLKPQETKGAEAMTVWFKDCPITSLCLYTQTLDDAFGKFVGFPSSLCFFLVLKARFRYWLSKYSRSRAQSALVEHDASVGIFFIW